MHRRKYKVLGFIPPRPALETHKQILCRSERARDSVIVAAHASRRRRHIFISFHHHIRARLRAATRHFWRLLPLDDIIEIILATLGARNGLHAAPHTARASRAAQFRRRRASAAALGAPKSDLRILEAGEDKPNRPGAEWPQTGVFRRRASVLLANKRRGGAVKVAIPSSAPHPSRRDGAADRRSIAFAAPIRGNRSN